MNVFFSKDINEDKIKLIDQEAQHCIKVLRKGRGEEVQVVDGQGSRYVCELEDYDRRSVDLKILSKSFNEKEVRSPHLAFGMIKNQTRLEWMLEKVTELGVQRITPLICQRSERNNIKRPRLEKILISAMKQSLNPYLPILDDPVAMMHYVPEKDRKMKYVASYGPNIPELSTLADKNTASLILIGPEGDFTKEELSHVGHHGYQRVNLGKSRLRAETACIVSCTLLRI